MHRVSSRTITALAIAATATFAAACGQSPVAPNTRASASTDPSVTASLPEVDGGGAPRFGVLAVGDTTASTPALTQIKICKAGNASGTFTVTASPANGGSPSVSSPITVDAGTCRIVAEDLDTGTTVGGNITVTETSAGLQSISAERNDAGTISSFSFSNGGTLFLNAYHGYTITFTNNVVVTSNYGCTPGYWKNHTDSWPAPYTPASGFNASFSIGTNWFANSLTLLQAASQGGGGTSALGRHATAALLNAAAGISPLTVAEVIARVQATYAGTYGVEATKDYFQGYNELGCPLN